MMHVCRYQPALCRYLSVAWTPLSTSRVPLGCMCTVNTQLTHLFLQQHLVPGCCSCRHVYVDLNVIWSLDNDVMSALDLVLLQMARS
jgi:hypothetical protein